MPTPALGRVGPYRHLLTQPRTHGWYLANVTEESSSVWDSTDYFTADNTGLER